MKPFIIAEVGSNWESLAHCTQSITLAKNCGANAVKFQAFSEAALFGFSDTVLDSNLPLHWLPKLKEKADACEIEFMCSAFSEKLLEAVHPFVNRHKIASSEMTHIRMLKKINELGSPVILSCGAQSMDNISRALNILEVDTTPLYCVAAYPARTVNSEVFLALKKHFKDYQWGFSDHAPDVFQTSLTMAKLGAVVLEKHVNFMGVNSPDAPHSISTEEFQDYVKAIRGTLSNHQYPGREELDMVLRHKRRFIAMADIPKGTPLEYGVNYGIFRSLKDDTHGGNPLTHIVQDGLRVKHDILKGSGISQTDLE
jgi:N-acetylneuraminate synthase